MLSADDAALLARERSLPGLALLLDEERFRARLARAAPGARLEAVRAHYLRWRPPVSCLVAYRVAVDGREVALHALTWGSLDRAKLDAAERKPFVPGPFGRKLLRWDDVLAAAWCYPNDDALSVLGAANVGAERRRLISKIAPGRIDLERSELERLAYRPARRFVGLLSGADGSRSVLRIYSSGEWERRARFASASRARSRTRLASAARIPREIGRSSRLRTALVEWLPGVSLRDLLDSAELPRAALESAGAAVAALHAESARTALEVASSARGERPSKIAKTLGALVPERAASIAASARRLESELDRVEREAGRAPIHGDLHAKQIVVDPDGMAGLLDLDGAALAPAAEDLGNFWAHLERDAARGRLADARVEEAMAAFVEGYRRCRELPARRQIELYRALGLLRLAGHAFRDRETSWRQGIGRIVDRVDELLRPGGAVR